MDHPSSPNLPFMLPRNPPQIGCSVSQIFRCETKIANLTYRISSLINFLSVSAEMLEFVLSTSTNFLIYQKQIILIVELARKTLESAGAVIYLWASCPKHLVPHKTAYIDLLRMLQSNEAYVTDAKLQKRLRVLLMPLTSRFSIFEHGDIRIDKKSQSRNSLCGHVPSSSSSSGIENDRFSYTNEDTAAMPPPDPFLDPIDPRIIWSKAIFVSKPSRPRLWYKHELRTHRSRKHDSRHRNKEDQENAIPAPVPFYQPPKQRFGIFLTGRSSMLGKHKERMGRPTH